MVHHIKSILTEEECKILTKQFDVDKRINPSFDIKADTGASYGFRGTYQFNTYLDKLKSKILEINSHIDDLTNVNTYIREYKNNAFLEKHVDRTDISVTISICLESTINKDWPLYAKINNQEHCVNINIGDGVVLFNADKNPHWRDTLICDQNERVVQFFLHWKPVSYQSKKSKSLL
jgi:hypothetical protein